MTQDPTVDVATDVISEATKAAKAEDAQVATIATVDVDEVSKAVDEFVVKIAKAVAAATIEEDDVDTLTYAIQESIPKKISAHTDSLKGRIDKITEDNRNHFELMEKEMKMTELDLSIDFSKKLLQIEETLG
ncbi:hypothetical protein Dimus_018242 [Dionaea muscipula]